MRTTVAVWVSWLRVFERHLNLALIIGFIPWWSVGKIREGGSSCELHPPCSVPKEKIEMSGLYLDNDDVVSFDGADYSLANAQTTRVNEIKSSLLNTWFARHLSGWITDGMSCRVLLAQGGGWQAGKVRFRIEFIPKESKVPEQKASKATSEPVSPLADL
ncbi:KGK domain-containing protein [Nostoc sp.]|uniref:KGK domain-containing protein n=1 Tax=Nostoc sp. TaxID=1180 RepID=UPI002FF4C7F2